MRKLHAIKYQEFNKFRMPAKLTKLKLTEHFVHVTLVTPKFSQYRAVGSSFEVVRLKHLDQR